MKFSGNGHALPGYTYRVLLTQGPLTSIIIRPFQSNSPCSEKITEGEIHTMARIDIKTEKARDDIRIGITMGDPAGIGPEIIIKAYTHNLPRHIPVIFGDMTLLKKTALNLSASICLEKASTPDAAIMKNNKGINIVSISSFSPGDITPGRVSMITGKAAGRYIESAITAAQHGNIDAVVTCPIHKKAFHEGGYLYPGHTEMFADKTGTESFGMMMASDNLKIALATIHEPLKNVSGSITIETLSRVFSLTLQTLRNWFGISSPVIGVLGLNPHAGEAGDIGKEEQKIIFPVIKTFQTRGEFIEGPLPADTAFIEKYRERYDAFIAMYHDQGLIPFKLLSFENGVNITMGLPFPRVSVDHGTGLDIAGKGVARPESLRKAIRWAIKMISSKNSG